MSHLSVAKNDRVLLEGPHSRTTEFWLVLRALRDFTVGKRPSQTSRAAGTPTDIR